MKWTGAGVLLRARLKRVARLGEGRLPQAPAVSAKDALEPLLLAVAIHVGFFGHLGGVTPGAYCLEPFRIGRPVGVIAHLMLESGQHHSRFGDTDKPQGRVRSAAVRACSGGYGPPSCPVAA